MCMGKVKKEIDEGKFLCLMNREFRNIFLSVLKEFNEKCPDSKFTSFKYSDSLRYHYCNLYAYAKYCDKTLPIQNRYLIRFLKEYYPKKYSWCRKQKHITRFYKLGYNLAYRLPIYMTVEFTRILKDSDY